MGDRTRAPSRTLRPPAPAGLPGTAFWLAVLLLTLLPAAGCETDPDGPTPEATERRVDTAGTSTQRWLLADSSASADAEVPFVPTDMEVVDQMLSLAGVDEDDVVYDLGSGDGRIVIRAADKFGARGVGIEINPELAEAARRNAERAGVADRVEIRQGDLFEADLSGATVVTLYLLQSVNVKLRPKLFRELDPGTPVVSHIFGMGDWEPDTTIDDISTRIHLWRVPEEVPDHLRE